MPVLRKRAKDMMRKKHGKKVSLTKLDKVWKEYVQYGIIKPLLKYGKVNIDDNFSIEIVGRRVETDKRVASMYMKGVVINKKGYKSEAQILSRNRHGVLYKIVAEDKSYKGKLVFDADKKLKKAVKEQLINTQQYYRIQ